MLNLEGGQALGTDVYAPQPPLFYSLVRGAAWAFGHDVPDVRKGIIAVFLMGAVGAYLLVRGLVGPWAGVAAAAFFVVAPPTPFEAARVHADLPALALTLLALGLAAQRPAGRRAQGLLAFSAGALLMVAVGVKLTALIGVLPLALLLARSARPAARIVAAAVGAAMAVAVVLLVYRHAIVSLWESLVEYRQAARRTPNLVSRREVLDSVLDLHAAFTIAVLLGIAAAALRFDPRAFVCSGSADRPNCRSRPSRAHCTGHLQAASREPSGSCICRSRCSSGRPDRLGSGAHFRREGKRFLPLASCSSCSPHSAKDGDVSEQRSQAPPPPSLVLRTVSPNGLPRLRSSSATIRASPTWHAAARREPSSTLPASASRPAR